MWHPLQALSKYLPKVRVSENNSHKLVVPKRLARVLPLAGLGAPQALGGSAQQYLIPTRPAYKENRALGLVSLAAPVRVIFLQDIEKRKKGLKEGIYCVGKLVKRLRCNLAKQKETCVAAQAASRGLVRPRAAVETKNDALGVAVTGRL